MSRIDCSFIVPTRNDGYAGSSAETISININHLIDGLSQSKCVFEIILVEWNPISGNESLATSLKGKILRSDNVRVRIFTVPEFVHKRYRNSQLSPYCQHGAINFGIRRSSGHFCVVKMQDTVYSKSVIDWLSKCELNERLVYRLDRVDVSRDLLERYCSYAQSESNLFEGGIRHLPHTHDRLHTNACGDFMLMAIDAWRRIRGEGDSDNVRMYGPDGLTIAKAIGAGLLEKRLPHHMVVFKPIHDSMCVIRNEGGNVGVPTGDSLVLIRALKQIAVLRAVGKMMRDSGLAILNLPKNWDGHIPVDSIYRFFLKYTLRIYLGRWISFGRRDWGFPDVNVASVDLN
jgi:hypothetical protein